MLLAQQMEDDLSADKRVRSFAFAKRSPYRQFAFAKRSVNEEESEVEKRARFAFAKRYVDTRLLLNNSASIARRLLYACFFPHRMSA
ncbi:unnamed protein product [Strongylus vulgaris]|uniref:Uncharacterized protein n=1 Tax=Strongylus vulgaris TaxID=40348 RepID=A0A3P7KJ45_STRVU|nr:unnamed protein product [Strongylus vulgaris]